jgi:hypothetical protein
VLVGWVEPYAITAEAAERISEITKLVAAAIATPRAAANSSNRVLVLSQPATTPVGGLSVTCTTARSSGW